MMKKRICRISQMARKTIIYLIIGIIYMNDSFASGIHPDSTRVYKIHYWVTGIIDVGGAAANVLAIKRIQGKPEMTDADFSTLNKNSFSKFDREAFKQDPSKKNTYESDGLYVMGGTIALPFLLTIDKKIRKNWGDLLLMYIEMHAITFGIYNYSFLGPTFQNKYRPVVYYDQFDQNYRRSGKNKSSFYSGHVASTAASSFFMVKVYSDYHPEIGWKKYLLYSVALIPPIIESYLRVKALQHFPSDNMVGLGVGILCGIIVPELHKIRKKGFSMAMYTSGDGAGLSLVWNPEYKYLGIGNYRSIKN
jgi:hypothetical protein